MATTNVSGGEEVWREDQIRVLGVRTDGLLDESTAQAATDRGAA